MRPALSTFALAAALAALSTAPAAASERMEKTLRLAPGGHFRLETDLGGVTVTGSAEPDVSMVVTSRHDLDDLLTFRYDESPSSVVVTARRKHHFGWFDSGHRVQFEIRVPAETAVDVNTSGGKIVLSALRSRAKLDTSGGGIDVRDLVGDLEADTSGGGIHLADIKGHMRVETSGGGITGSRLDGPLSADTSGGSIELERVTGDIKASSSGGSITILEAGGRIEAETSGGGIEATFTRGNARGGSLETSGGGIRVSVDPDAGLEIDAHGNSVKTELPLKVVGEISRSSLRGTLGSGGAKLHLRTSGGGVVIQGL